MPRLNISDAENAYLEADETVEEFKAEFERIWFRPVRKMMVRALFSSLPNTVLAQFPEELIQRAKEGE